MSNVCIKKQTLLSKIIRTSSGASQEKTPRAVSKVLMGRMPDSKGQPNEIKPAPPQKCPLDKKGMVVGGGGGEDVMVQEVSKAGEDYGGREGCGERDYGDPYGGGGGSDEGK